MSIDQKITLQTMHQVLGWPAPEDVIHPVGAGASVFADLVREKIGRALHRFSQTKTARVGVLMANPNAKTSEPPLAIVIESQVVIDDEVLRELHRLSWNFSHSPTLITIEPTLLRVWSCCEPPDPISKMESYLVHQLHADDIGRTEVGTLELQAARALHWINFVSGQFYSDHAERFDRDGRADQMLLGNLQYIREELANQGLVNDDICHDLLARVIFVQFLFDRKDQDGNPALTAAKLHRLQNEGVLRKKHDSFDSILSEYGEAYRLFDWLNAKFNGDLFPGKGETPEERAKGWASEKQVVKARHLSLLAEFIRGDLDMPARQKCLWPQYAFDVIPLEFISSIYEAFVTERAADDGIFYTPPYLVDFVLDRVLPWDGAEWNLKIIDPACGSGIFLVKAFQRLVHRWKLSNPGQALRAETLRRLLERNLFGVDKDPHAVRVACFSLYLAMCDEIEPRHYWTQVTFPSMRQRRLICSDFFSEDKDGFNTERDSDRYDLVVGNAPWGKGVITSEAEEWAADDGREWAIPNEDIGGLFVAKGAQLVSEEGRVALIQSANTLLFNISGTVSRFRTKLFRNHRVESIYNLSALRFRVFNGKTHTTKKSVAPACILILSKEKPSPDAKITYVSPKHLRPLVDEFSIIVEPQDQQSVTVEDAVSDALIWSKLMWGNARDLQLLRKLHRFPNLKTLEEEGAIKSQRGIVFGDRKKPAFDLIGRRIFDRDMFPEDSILYLRSDDLPVMQDVMVDARASTNRQAFSWPQLLIKLSWIKSTGRFHSRLNLSERREGIMCNQSYLSVHGDLSILQSVCLAQNSKIAVYFHFLTSGRFAAYRPKLSKDDIRGLPIPPVKPEMFDQITSYSSLDENAFDLFSLNDAERVLIEDAIDYRLNDFLGGDKTQGKQSTAAKDEAHLRAYCEYFIRVLKAGFGQERGISATILRPPSNDVPYRLVAFVLSDRSDNSIKIESIKSGALIEELERLNQLTRSTDGSLYNQRVARIYDASSGLPTVFMLKPDQKRFWTRSAGLQDGDEVALDLFKWQHSPLLEDEEALH